MAEPDAGVDVGGRPGYRLTDEGVKDGISRLTWVSGVFNDRGLHRVMSEAVYADMRRGSSTRSRSTQRSCSSYWRCLWQSRRTGRGG